MNINWPLACYASVSRDSSHTGGRRCELPESATDTFRTWYLLSKSNAISWSVNSLRPLSQEMSSLWVQDSLIPITKPSPVKAAHNSFISVASFSGRALQLQPKIVMIFWRKRIRSSSDRSLVRSANYQDPVQWAMLLWKEKRSIEIEILTCDLRLDLLHLFQGPYHQ